MIEKTPNKNPETTTMTTMTTTSTSHSAHQAPPVEKRPPVTGGLPGAQEGKAALINFELGHLDFSEHHPEEQQAFDFGAEFAQARPTVAMLDKSDLPAEISEQLTGQFAMIEEDPIDALPGDDESQLDFIDAAKAILAEEAVRAGAREETRGDAREEIELPEVSKASFANVSLPQTQIESDTELMREITQIPQQMAFKIGDVADIVGVKQYVLRYWESEFEALKPRKSKNGQRVYTRKEVETALMIKKLLYKDRFSIEGARSALRNLKGKVREDKQWNTLMTSHESIKDGVKDLLAEIRRFRSIMN